MKKTHVSIEYREGKYDVNFGLPGVYDPKRHYHNITSSSLRRLDLYMILHDVNPKVNLRPHPSIWFYSEAEKA